MRKVFTILFLSILFLILDNAIMPFMSIKGIYPSLLFVFVICYSIINGKIIGVIIGVTSGLLQDVYLSNGIGINMLINMLICVIAAEVGKTIFKDKAIIPVTTCFFLSFLKGILMFCILYILGQRIHINVILYRSLYNMVIGFFMYKRIYKLCEKDFMMKNWKF